jgi:hypothetical protein
MKIELEDVDVDSDEIDGVWIWRSVPSRGQNHMVYRISELDRLVRSN